MLIILEKTMKPGVSKNGNKVNNSASHNTAHTDHDSLPLLIKLPDFYLKRKAALVSMYCC